ncbi:helicase IV [Azotobacter chroococcum subsp. isscasi]|nr:UvrD-helicase domain-containing protein [Azotobacter chroococcum]TBW10033.1 helicase IV [Azotobacter chroococcum subsp. isscasi]
MRKEWGASTWGRILTGSPQWHLRLEGQDIALIVDGRVHRTPIHSESTLQVHQGLVWTDLTLFPGLAGEKRVDGLPNAQAESLKAALAAVLADRRLKKDLEFLVSSYLTIRDWLDQVSTTIRQADGERRWVTYETQQALHRSRPNLDGPSLWTHFRNPAIQQRLPENPATVESALKLWEFGWPVTWAQLNEEHVQRELVACKDLFNQVESKPLTEEQARAVICFDNRVQVVASAGSGKTSTMVAKAAYAIHRGFVAPERIVLLAFNKKAAEELKERAARSFKRLGMNDIIVEASTFHALGLSIIGKATGRKPDVPDWAIDAVAGFRKLTEIIDQLKDRSEAFRTQWDQFRLVFSRDLPAFGASIAADAWDKDGNGYVCTIRGERVRSHEELMIANWLFLNGVAYEYERRYEFDTASETHRQYRPDFYYPDAKLYHEHFALDEQGQAPKDFNGYLEGVAWKRQLHEEKGTDLVETTSHLLRNGNWMSFLGKALADRGIKLDPNPDRLVPEDGQKPMEHAELAGLMRTFISHAKSNCLSVEDLKHRLEELPKGTYTFRYRMFLDLVGPVLQAWDAALSKEDGIDFEDMLNLAAEHLEQGRYEAPYDLVMADEFQDASRARARLCRAMVQKPGRHLFAVGDDWQSINRFAGADVSVMTGFKEWFGHGQVLKLEQTFRCPQALCDVSSRFVSKNPAQISKQVRSVSPPVGPVLQAFQVNQREKIPSAINQFLDQLCQGLSEGSIPPGRGGKVSVAVLGRYNFEQAYLPERWRAQYGRWVELSFLTIHRSKGSEADYVILPSMISRLRGGSFPNTRTDDPILALAMPSGDNFSLGEERRLFYVALTRARRCVAMFTVSGQRSTFLSELVDEQAVVVTNSDGEVVNEKRCPVCKQGVIVPRNGPYGEFQSCSNFPFCEHKPKKKKQTSESKVVGKLPSLDEIFTMARTPHAHVAMPSMESCSYQGAPVTSAAKLSQPIRQAPTTPSPPARTTFRGFFESISNGLEEVNKSISQAHALQAATSDLEIAIFTERLTIEKALEAARSALDLQAFLDADPKYAEFYHQAFEELQAVLNKTSSAQDSCAHKLSPSPLPDFRRTTKHSDPDTEEAIQRKILALKGEREAFLSAVHTDLSRDSKLCTLFEEKLYALEGDHYWAALDPRHSLKKS